MLEHRGRGGILISAENRDDHGLVLLIGVLDVAGQQGDVVEQVVERRAVVGDERDE